MKVQILKYGFMFSSKGHLSELGGISSVCWEAYDNESNLIDAGELDLSYSDSIDGLRVWTRETPTRVEIMPIRPITPWKTSSSATVRFQEGRYRLSASGKNIAKLLEFEIADGSSYVGIPIITPDCNQQDSDPFVRTFDANKPFERLFIKKADVACNDIAIISEIVLSAIQSGIQYKTFSGYIRQETDGIELKLPNTIIFRRNATPWSFVSCKFVEC